MPAVPDRGFSRRSRKFFRISLRGLVVLVLLIGAGLG